jgi:hypothetical protein
MPRTLPVLFRVSRDPANFDHPGETVTAIFPSEPWTHDVYGPVTCYAHVGQHGSCTHAWYRTTRPATPADYGPLLAELRGFYAPEYTLKVIQRWPSERRAVGTEDATILDIRETAHGRRYYVSWHVSGNLHRDGSPFYDLRIFTNRGVKDRFLRQLRARVTQ